MAAVKVFQTKSTPSRLLAREPIRPRGFLLFNTENSSMYFSDGAKWIKLLSTANTRFDSIDSGTYVPNVLSVGDGAVIVDDVHSAHYTHIGSVVQVMGSLTVSGGKGHVEISLPVISSEAKEVRDVRGVAASGSVQSGSQPDRVRIVVDITQAPLLVSYSYAYSLQTDAADPL